MSEQTDTMTSGKVPPSLQSIPPELRLMIYEHALLNAEPINLSNDPSSNSDTTLSHQAVGNFRALSMQCRMMQYETESIFFAHNTFQFLANGQLPAIPSRYVEMMANIQLYRILIGKMFMLKIHRCKGGGVSTSIEVLEVAKERSKEQTPQTRSVVEDTIANRLTQGAAIAARMIRREIADGRGMHMAVLQAIVARMNQQWIIAM